MDTLLRDLRYSLRILIKEPGFTLLGILTLGLGIGATTAIFTVVDSVLLRPLPYKDSDRLVVAMHGPEASSPVSPADYLDYREQARSFEGLAAAQAWGGTLGGGDRPERVSGLQVSANLLDVLGVPALHGRTFVEGEDQPGRDRVAVLSYGLWQRRFGADPAIVGRDISVDGQSYSVVGVMPATFRFAPFWQTRSELWVPLTLTAKRTDRTGRSLRLFGRLRDGVSVARAHQEMTAIAARLEREYPESNTGISIAVRPLLDKVVSGVRATLLALMSMVTFVLLIACANVASAMLARASGRQQEVAVRLALGASPWRVVRQLLTESLLLASAGASVGFALAVWGVHWLVTMLPAASLPRQQDVGFDLRVFAAATIATLVAGVATGLVPALQITRPGLVSAFQGGQGRNRRVASQVGSQPADWCRSRSRTGAARGSRVDGPDDARPDRCGSGFSSGSPRRGGCVIGRNASRQPGGAISHVSAHQRTPVGAAGHHVRQRHQSSSAGRRRMDSWLLHRRAPGAHGRAEMVGGLQSRRRWVLRNSWSSASRRA